MDLFDKISKYLTWALVAAALAVVVYSGYKYTNRKTTIVLATASKGGFYYKFGQIFKEYVEKNTDLKIDLKVTKGSLANRKHLLKGEADLAIMQTGAVELDHLAAVSPLWNDYVHVLVKKDFDNPDKTITAIRDFHGKKVSLGKMGSGYRANSGHLFKHYGINMDAIGGSVSYFKHILDDQQGFDGAVVTTNLLNPDLNRVMDSGRYELIDIDSAEGLAFHHPSYTVNYIPAGAFKSKMGPVPTKPIKTVSTLAALMARPDTDPAIINTLLPLLYELELRRQVPVLISKNEISNGANDTWGLLPVHATSARFFNPYTGVERVSGFLDAIFSYKEVLLFVLIGLVIGITKLMKHRRMKSNEQFLHDMRQLELYLTEAISIEKRQKDAKEQNLLMDYYHDIIRVKNEAIKVFQGSDVTNSNLFASFLQETTHIIREIEWKLSLDMNKKKS